MVSLNQEILKQWQEQNMEPLRYAYDLYPDDIVLDIGSYRREWGKEIESRYGCSVNYFDALDNKAAWLFDGTIKMGGDYLYTSIYAEKVDKEYRCVDIAHYLQEEIALVKINIEGGEYELLNYIIDRGLMNNVVNLQVQFHLIEGMIAESERMYNELAKRLKQTHEISWRYPFVWESWQRRKEFNRLSV